MHINLQKPMLGVSEGEQAEEELRNQADLLDLFHEGIMTRDPDGKIRSWNHGAERMYGYSKLQATGTISHTLLRTIFPKPLVEIEADLLQTGLWEGELTHTTQAGTRIAVASRWVLQRDEYGQASRVVDINSDITQRKLAEEALREAGTLQRAIFNSANFSSIATDAQGTIQMFNVGAERMLGYAAADVMNKITPAYLSDRQELSARAKELTLEFGTPIAPGFEALAFKASRGMEDIYELTYIRKDGRRLPVIVSVTALRDAQDAITGYLLIGTDNSARKQAEEALRETGALLRTIHLHSIVSVADRAGIIVDVNDSFCTISGYSRDELLGQTHRVINSGVHSPEFWTDMWRNISSGKSWRGEICNRSKKGSLYWVDSIIVPFLGEDGRTTKFISIRTDITAAKLFEGQLREETQKAERANRIKSDFLANMSHEIRTPMNAIMGMTHLALRASRAPEQRGYLVKISNAAESLLNIINDILDFSKIEVGKLELEHIAFSLDSVLNNLRDIIDQKAEQKKIGLIFTVDPDAPRYLKGDPLRLGQILVNLVNNAIKFTEKGQVIVKVLAEDGKGSGRLRFSVHDTGIGMTPGQIANLFQSFNQADTSTTRKYGGTGLGLAISKQLCEMMGGTLTVQSEIDKGSTFLFTADFGIDTDGLSNSAREETFRLRRQSLLIADDHEDATQALDPVSGVRHAPGLDAGHLAGRRVLLVEDNEINRDLATELLADLGIQVTIAVDGREGINRVAAEPFDLVLMDIQMPVMDGLTATRLIRADERLRTLPIIAMTAHAMSGDRERSLKAGMTDHLTKPISPEGLTQALLRWMPAEPVQRTAPERAQPSPADDGLPEGLAPFDMRAALARTNGRPELLRKMMLGFRNQYATAAADLRGHLNKGRREDAERLAHSLKGVARTLETKELGDAAAAVEKALRAETAEDMGSLIERLEKALYPAIAAAASLDRRAAPPSLGRPEAGVGDAGVCILVVDDESLYLDLLTSILGNDNEVLYASEGMAALRIIAARKPDVILLDVMMPGIDGYEVCKRLKAEPRSRDIPIIFLTSLGDVEDETKGLAMGAVDYVTKPINPLAVRARVDHQIKLKRAQDELIRLASEEQAALLAKELERAAENDRISKQELQLRDDFLSHVSHELRSPLASIHSFSTIIADGLAGQTTQQQDAYLQIIQKNVRQLHAMIEDLLAVTAVKTGKLGVHPQRVSVSESIVDAVHTLQGASDAKGVDLSFSSAADLAAYVDPSRLLQVLIILCDNAIKFTPAGGSVKVQARVFEKNLDFLVVEVSDTGCGIKPELTERIFEHLYQVTDASQAGRKGLGLGLHIARELVMLQGGEIWANNPPPEVGSQFSFTVPVFVGQCVAEPMAA